MYSRCSIPLFPVKTQWKLIDSIWTFLGLTVFQCGFLPFHDVYSFQSDHRLVWANICNDDLLGHRPQHIYCATRSKSRSNDPDIREKYIQRCLEKYRCGDDINDFQTLASFCQKKHKEYDIHDKIIHLYASLAIKIETVQLEVDKSLGQFFIGSVPWSPTL